MLANDSDVDVGDTLTAAVASGPANGTLILSGSGGFTYTPATTFAGIDSFTYTASDGHGGSATATVTINVTAATDGSIISDSRYLPGRHGAFDYRHFVRMIQSSLNPAPLPAR